MKKIILSTIFFSAILFFSNCKKDDSPSSVDDLPAGSIVAKIDGQNFEASVKAQGKLFNNGINLELKGTNAPSGEDGDFLTITFLVPAATFEPPIIEVGYTETCDENNNFICAGATLQINSGNDVNYYFSETANGGSSSVTFSEIEYETGGTIKGIFSAFLVDGFGESKTISDGKFHLIIE